MLGSELGVAASALRGPSGPPLSIDFQANLYRRAGRTSATFVGLGGTSFSRSGAGLASRADGGLESFAADAPRITDRGLLLEAAATNLAYPSVSPATWPSVASVTLTAAAAVGVFTAPARVASTGNSGGYLATTNGVPYVSGAVYTVQIWYGADGNGGAIYVNLPGQAYASRSAAGVWFFSGGGAFSEPHDEAVSGSIRKLTLTLTSPVTGGGRIGVGPGSPVVGEAIVIYGAQVEAGSSSTSLIVTTGASATRGADSASVTVPPGAATYEAIYGDAISATGAVTPGAEFDLIAGRPWIGSGNALKRLIMT